MDATALGTRRRGQRGMVTAELAVATLAAMTMLLLLSWGIYLLVMQIRCIDTAAEVARQAARDDAAAVSRATREAPTGSHVRISRSESLVTVEVSVVARPLARGLAAVPLHAEAEVVPEPERPR